MKKQTNIAFVGVIGAMVLSCLVVSLALILVDDEVSCEDSVNSVRRSKIVAVMNPDPQERKKTTRIKLSERPCPKRSIKDMRANGGDILKDVIEDAELNELQREVMRQIQAALDDNSISKLRAAIRKLREMEAERLHLGKGARVSLAKLPVALRRATVEALGWFGTEGMADIVEFIADDNPEIAEDALSKFEAALQDVALSDREKADIVVMASQAITDRDALESIFMEFSNMRHSVGIAAILDVAEVGTPEAKSLMPENMEFFTGEENIDSREKAAQWLQENPDDECDEEFYGGWKEE